MIEELQNKKMEAAKEVSVDTAIGMLESFCEPAETALETIKALNEEDYDTVAGNVVDLTDEDSSFGKGSRVGVSLYSAICEYNEKLEAINGQIGNL